MHIAILTGVQDGRKIRQKDSHILLKKSFWSFFSEMKVTCMLIACFIFWIFPENASFFSSYVVAYIWKFPS